jgi:hypothetical protein
MKQVGIQQPATFPSCHPPFNNQDQPFPQSPGIDLFGKVILPANFQKVFPMSIHKFSMLFIVLTFLLCGEMSIKAQTQVQTYSKTQQKADFPSGYAYKNNTITYQLIQGINNTWGYDILVDNKLTIHQPSIPSLPGNEGFKVKESAEKVAKLVIKKMKKGEMPPSIDAEEMKKLKAI